MKSPEIKSPEVKIEIRNVKHTFTAQEKGEIGNALARAFGEKRNIEAEFDQVKQSYKAKISEQDSKICTLSTDLVNGFDMRNQRMAVLFDRVKGEKALYYEDDFLVDMEDGMIDLEPVMVEKMTSDDFQAELLQAEAKFEHRVVFDIFPPAGNDRGEIVVGKFGNRWFSAVRIRVGKVSLEERLDSEQKSFKNRADAVARAGKRAMDWIKETFKETSKGFAEPLEKALAEQADRVE